ncbi:unnamed protein product [Miscanthus lutarioriparius]|uniref:Cleavage stimulation factor 50 kDa subunit n=1 Tax=Miscanthus lutarioriparius TaxID=422564 RepID=A0A811R233_9POAL|nr:unnamed protein product [Miscanthus lutarioriparius]
MTPSPLWNPSPPINSLRLMAKGLTAELEEEPPLRIRLHGFGGLVQQLGPKCRGFQMQDVKGSSKSFPKHEVKHVSTISCNLQLTIALSQVAKIKQTMVGDSKDGPARPVIRTFYDHTQAINGLDFHPKSPILISAAKDNTIKFFDFSKTNARKAFRVIQVRYSCTGSLYVTASKDGSLHIWDGVSAECVRPITGAHGSAEATSAIFTKDER